METKEYEKLGIKSPHEIQVYIPERWMLILEKASSKYRIPISQILLRVLGNPDTIEVPDALTRPKAFHEPMHRFTMRFAGDHKAVVYGRIKWARFEFGPFVRFLLEEYIEHLDELIEKTDGMDLSYQQTNIVETKPRIELTDHTYKWHIYSYEVWAYFPSSSSEQGFPAAKVCRYMDDWWYNHPLIEEVRARHKDKLQ